MSDPHLATVLTFAPLIVACVLAAIVEVRRVTMREFGR
jgi:hypothetical protein